MSMLTRRAFAIARATTTTMRLPMRGAVSRMMSASGETIGADMKRRDHAAEAVFFHEQDLMSLRSLARKIRAASAKQRGSSLAKEELASLKTHVPETSTLSEDALQRLLDWKHA